MAKKSKDQKQTKPKEDRAMVTVPLDDLLAIHNQLLMTKPSGEMILATANMIMTLRRLMSTPQEAYAETEDIPADEGCHSNAEEPPAEPGGEENE